MSVPKDLQEHWDREEEAVDQEIDQTRRLLELTRPLSEIKAEPIRWLWPLRIARGKVTMIAGDPKLGKSLLTADIAARISAGQPWPVDGGNQEPADVVFASAEDDAGDTIRPRIEAAGGDPARVHIIDMVLEAHPETLEIRERPFNLKSDAARLAKEIERLGNVAAVIIDPITAYLGGTDSHKNAEVRELLLPLAKLAAELKVAVIVVSHLNKGTGGNALYRVSGSLAFTAAARACYLVTKDPDQDGRRLVLPSGSNIAPDVGGLAYEIAVVDSEVGPVPVLAWHPEPIALDATDALAGDQEERAERNDAADWLVEILTDGPMPAAEVKRKASAEGFAWRTIQRSRKQAGVISERTGFGKGSQWCIRANGSPSPNRGANGANGANGGNKGVPEGDKTHSCHSRQAGTTGTDGTDGEVTEL